MFIKVLPFSALVAQGRWKVEFFISDGNGVKSKAFPLVPLKDILAERRGALDPQQYSDHVFNYLGLEHVQSMTGDLADGYTPKKGREVLSRSKVFYRGDVLYGRLRPSLNKVFIAEGAVSEGICSGEFYVLIPDQKRILPHFARALLASRYVQDAVKSMTTGSALPRLALDDLLEIEIPLPPIDVQQQYEEALIQQNAKRQRLIADLREIQSTDLDSVVNALEEGRELCFSRPARSKPADTRTIKLPAVAAISQRGRGRPSSSEDSSLF